MISCRGIRRQEIFSGNRFGTNKKILSSILRNFGISDNLNVVILQNWYTLIVCSSCAGKFLVKSRTSSVKWLLKNLIT